jgi:hypothetical protein
VSYLLPLPGGVDIQVTRKDIRTLRLRVHAPDGRVTLSAPAALAPEAVEAFARERLAWIGRQRQRLASVPAAPVYHYVDGELHWFDGRRYGLGIVERQAPARVTVDGDRLVLRLRPGSTVADRRALLESWYRRHLKRAIPRLIDVYEPRLRVQVQQFGIRRMKTRWGSCNVRAGRIWLNLDLARHPHAGLEYVVVHEMVHLLEPRHGPRFRALMDRYLPDWRVHDAGLRRLPVAG